MTDTTAIQVLIPTPLRGYTNGEAKVGADGATVGDVLTNLETRYPGLRERVCDPDGEIRRFVNVFVNGENVRKLQGAATPLQSGDELGIIPAMAGGE
jgi:molybdopterin synthase sulfur carrier subunit